MSAGGTGLTRQIETPAGQRAAGLPAERQQTGPQERPQQHRKPLQPERQGHMRFGTAIARSRQQQKH